MTTNRSTQSPRRVAPVNVTPRQREVLDLLVKGQTNAQIADALGVSLDGAKWHVREILAEFGVESREEAAALWRDQRGIGARAGRLARALSPGGLALRFGLAGVVAVAAAVAAVFFISLGGPGETPPSDAPAATPTLARPGALSNPGTPGPATATATAAPAGETLQMGGQAGIGYDTTVYYSTGCFGCGRPDVPNLYRYRLDPDGTIERRDLFTFLAAFPQGYVQTFAAEWGRGHFVAGVCVEGYCGGEGEATTDKPLRLFQTHDGRITWEEAGTIPLGHYLTGFVSDRTRLDARFDGEVLVSYTQAEFQAGYYLWPSGVHLAPPDVGRRLFPDIVEGLGVFWVSFGTPDNPEGVYYDSQGLEVARVPGAPGGLIGTLKHGGWIVQWHGDDGVYVGHYDGSMQWARRWTTDYFAVKGIIGPTVGPGGQEEAAQLYANVLLEDFYCFQTGTFPQGCNAEGRMFPLQPSIIRPNTGTVHPLAAISDGLTGNTSPFVHAIDTNPHARVVANGGAGDCLNVRAEPAPWATVLECVPDGVLLVRQSDAPVESGGTTWIAVWSTRFERGWASTEFLR